MSATKQVFYFEHLNDPAAFAAALDAAGVALTRLDYDMPRAEIDRVLRAAQAYQLQNRSWIAREHGYGGDRAMIERCPNLLVISTPGSGYDAVDLDDCTAAGVLVVNQAGLHAEAVAEHALGMMIGLSKCMIQAHMALHGARDWRRQDHVGRDIYGKTLGILGFGAIGRRLAEICRTAFRMRVITHHPRRSAAEIGAAGAEALAFERVLAEADYVVAALPLTDATRGLFGVRQFALMRDTAYFITVARGGIHDETALAAALAAGEIAGAGVDVWQEEPPPPDHPLLALPNVLATPHNAGRTYDSWQRVTQGTAAQLIAVLQGKRPPRLLNPAVWPRYCERFERIMGHSPEQRSTT